MEFEILPPLELNRNSDPNKVGRGQAAVHKMRYKQTYSSQGFSVDVEHRVETRSDGTHSVRLFAKLTKIE
jgi:hypothetical protein